MKNYKINIFDDKELLNKYNSIITNKISWDKESVKEHYSFFNNTKINNINKLIFNLYNFSCSDYIIISDIDDLTSQLITEDEILNDYNDPAKDRNDIYITEDWTLCSWKCIDFTLSCMPDKEKKEFIYKKYNGNYSIILDKNKENLYLLLKKIWLNVIWISWSLYYDFETKEEPNWDTYINYLVNFNKEHKENFIRKSIIYIENEIKSHTKWPVIKKLKSDLLDKIIKLNKEYWTEWKDIYINDEDYNLLLLLHLDNKIKINIKKDNNLKDEIYIDIIGYWKEEWIYFNENNWDVTNNGNKIWNIKPSTQEYKLFKYLYDNKLKLKTYDDIFKKLNWWKTEKDKSKYLADIKNRIKPKELKNLIKNTQWKWYYIP